MPSQSLSSPSQISGAPGLFDVKLSSAGNGKPAGEEVAAFRVGAIVQATGWSPADPRPSLPYGRLEDVILNVDLEAMVDTSDERIRELLS